MWYSVGMVYCIDAWQQCHRAISGCNTSSSTENRNILYIIASIQVDQVCNGKIFAIRRQRHMKCFIALTHIALVVELCQISAKINAAIKALLDSMVIMVMNGKFQPNSACVRLFNHTHTEWQTATYRRTISDGSFRFWKPLPWFALNGNP